MITRTVRRKAGGLMMITVGLLALSSPSLLAQKRRLTPEELAERRQEKAQAEADAQTVHRIQFSESCSSVAKWLTQAVAPEAHWEMLNYDPELGVLRFKVLQPPFSKAEIYQYVQGKAKQVRAEGVVFTLGPLVTSTPAVGGQSSNGDSCAIASAFQFAGKDGPALSNGRMEAELMNFLSNRQAEHGFEY
jgi:hypothetical protein